MPTEPLLQAPKAEPAPRLVVFDTHPIQYRAPVLKEIFRRHPSLKVFLFNETFDGDKWWFRERNQIPRQTWGLKLREGYPNEVVGTAGLGLASLYRRLRDILLREKPSAILIFGYFSVENWLLWWCCRRLGIRLLFVGDTFNFVSRGVWTPLKRFLLFRFFSGIGKFISNGEKNYAHYRRLGIPEERIARARYCIDTSFFEVEESRAREMRRAWRERHGIAESAFVALFVGRLIPRKRAADFLEMARRVPTAQFIVVGNGMLEKDLRAEARPLANVQFTGFLDQGGAREAYYGGDLLVVPSEYETWGFVAHEAAACGLPSMVTDTCGVAGDLVVHGETGIVYPRADVSAAVEHLRTLIDGRESAARLGAGARRRVSSHFHMGQFVDAILGALDQL